MASPPNPLKVGVLLFPGFQLLDYAGPIDAFNILSLSHPLTLCTIASSLSPVPTHNSVQTATGSTISQSVVPTHTLASAPKDLDVLLIPGGIGARDKENEDVLAQCVAWLGERGVGGEAGPKWVLTVCTGSEVLARTGVLDGRRATTNKRAFNDVKAKHPNVKWVAKARWVVDGNIWTSSGISAGIDLAFAWMADVFGEEMASFVADRSEYERNVDPENDRFAGRWGAV
ncbi:hypothetical protein J1614_001598 [Plenodomus biglobosus]|nr:hypothetical protein J1614_001598 [Plenodomus biglobosus]